MPTNCKEYLELWWKIRQAMMDVARELIGLGMDVNCKTVELIFRESSKFTESVAQSLGLKDDEHGYNWLSWYAELADQGNSPGHCWIRGEEFYIGSIESLAKVIEYERQVKE